MKHHWLFLGLLGACATEIHVKDYDRTCSTDADCAVVYEGPRCRPHCNLCPNAALRSTATARYQIDMNNIDQSCPKILEAPCAQVECAAITGRCEAGQCQAVRP